MHLEDLRFPEICAVEYTFLRSAAIMRPQSVGERWTERIGRKAMEGLRLVLLYAHLIGFGLLLGGAVTQYLGGTIRINPAMLWGAVIQLITGAGLAAPLRDEGDEPDPAKLAVKGVIALAIFAMVFFSRKREAVNRGHFLAIVGLTLVNAAVAVFWR
jgi:hypothetical protein